MYSAVHAFRFQRIRYHSFIEIIDFIIDHVKGTARVLSSIPLFSGLKYLKHASRENVSLRLRLLPLGVDVRYGPNKLIKSKHGSDQSKGTKINIKLCKAVSGF